tara:strand:- start:347 stop:604 length:258 start_codon:yes stop_codon:yes gene_type:complete
MASIQLTQMTVTNSVPATPPLFLFVVEGSENLIAINPAYIISVGVGYQSDGSVIPNIRTVYLTGVFSPIYVTDSYATVKAYMDAV